MKRIEISAEWILDNFTDLSQADGHGNVTIIGESIGDSRWIDLVLDTLGIHYDIDTYGGPIPDESFFWEIHWTFKIESVKDDCPNLYVKWMEMDLLSPGVKTKN
jgi:hypothetical protein